jgi:LacI family transcriptional regulator
MPANKSPKYHAVSRKIEAQIRDGRWRDGEVLSARVVARENGVSMVTASRAIQVLRDSGLIKTIDRIGSYVAPPTSKETLGEIWSLCTRITPGASQQGRVSLVQESFREIARRESFVVDTEAFLGIEKESTSRLLGRVRRAIDSGSTGLFLLPARYAAEAARTDEGLLDACRSEGLPVVLIERNLRGLSRRLEHDLVASDDLDGSYRCTTHLLEQGRQRLAFINGSPTSSHQARVAGYLLAIEEAAPEGTSPLILDEAGGIPSRDAYRELVDRIMADRLDGVVCYQDQTAIGLIMELLMRGVRVPQDVAITGFDDLPIGQSFALGVTTYPFPWPLIAQEAVHIMRRRLRDPSAPVVKCLVPSQLIVRESSRCDSDVAEKACSRLGA